MAVLMGILRYFSLSARGHLEPRHCPLHVIAGGSAVIHRQRSSIIITAIIMLLALLSYPAHANDRLTLYAQEIKAGMLYNFLKYTEWPASKQKEPEMVLCIFGADPFQGYIRPLQGKSVNQRKIRVKYVRQVEETGQCHLLFLNAAEKNSWPELQKFLHGKAVLTVSDLPEFAAKSGGMIAFSQQAKRIQVQLNLQAVKNGQLRVEERLLRLVTVVSSDGA